IPGIETMQIEEELKAIAPQKETVFTVGVFDGVHLGHRHLLSRVIERAREHGWLSGVLTFKSHPQLVLRPDSNLALLDNLEHRLELLKSLGIDIVTALSFTPELSRLGPREFITLLKDQLKIRGLIIGPDFALGKDREGSANQLYALGRELGFSVEAMSPFTVNGEVVSSSSIRRALSTGNMDKVNKYLGRPFRLAGKVVHGDQRGGSVLGFPTANIDVPENQAIPADGVYATIAYLNHEPLPSVTNIGLRPTFKGNHRTIETFILDFQGELHDQDIKVEFVGRLREEKRFNTPDMLTEQIRKDVEQARLILGK
ncbi:MAG: bifunctional riboflavin kinase/FAD synthetase, partial [Dehalococcoidia bacterium]